MNPQHELRLRRIEKMSSALRGVCTALIGGVVAVLAMAALAIAFGRMRTVNYFGQSLDLAALGPASRIVLKLLVFVLGGLAIKALYHLRRLLGLYALRQVFTTAASRQIRQFGYCCMLWGGLKIAWALLPVLRSTPPMRPFGVTLDSFAIGAVIVAIASLSEMAAELREENDLTI